MRYGDGNQKLFPVVGIGGGAPEPYVSSSHSFESGLKDLTNAATVVFARRSPIPRGGVWRPELVTPVIFTEEGTNNVAAVNSVTFVRGPFQIIDTHNFSFDNHTRILFFTSSLGLTSPPIPAPSILSVQINGIVLVVQNVGPVTGVNGMTGSYLIIRLPDNLPSGNLSLTVTLRGKTSAPATLQIAP